MQDTTFSASSQYQRQEPVLALFLISLQQNKLRKQNSRSAPNPIYGFYQPQMQLLRESNGKEINHVYCILLATSNNLSYLSSNNKNTKLTLIPSHAMTFQSPFSLRIPPAQPYNKTTTECFMTFVITTTLTENFSSQASFSPVLHF